MAVPYGRSRAPSMLCAALVSSLALAGCASLPGERGRDAVATELGARSGRAVTLATAGPGGIDDSLRTLLAQPLSADAAVELAWRNSPRSRAALAELGLAAADLFEASRPRNPGLSWSRLGNEYSLGLHVVLTDLLTLPARRRIGALAWQAAIAEAVDVLLEEAARVRRDYYRALAAEQVAELRAAVAEAAELSAEMARRFHAAGNISALQLAREEADATQSRAAAAKARVERLASRMKLAERLGLAGRTNRWSLPDRLPLPLPLAADVDALLAQASARRGDLAAARASLDAHGRDARLARRIGRLGDVELGVEREREGDERRSGPSVDLELPLFDQGQGRVARAEAERELALQRIEAIELGIERAVRTGAARLAVQAEIIDTYREALIPQREAIVARQLERYNFMLIGVGELLEARREEFDTYQDYLEAIRDWWIAHGELERAIGGPLPLAGEPEYAPRAQDVVSPPSDNAHDMHGHH